MRIFVTGGSGFIGEAFIAKAIKSGHEVVVFDQKPSIGEVKFIYGDIMDYAHLERAMAGCDAVVHLAAMLGVRNTEQNYLKTLDVNIQGTKNVLEACVKNNVKKILFSSSSEIYGNPEKIPISEDDKINPVSVYGFSKAVCEYYIRAYHQTHGLNFAIVRYFNVYGVSQRNDFVVPKMISRAASENPVEVYGDGSQVRAFTHVTDAAHGTLLALEKGNNDVFNIGNDKEPVSMKELAIKVLRLTGSRAGLKHVNLSDSDRDASREIFKRIPNIAKARKILGYEPRKSLEEGIFEIISHVRNVSENI